MDVAPIAKQVRSHDEHRSECDSSDRHFSIAEPSPPHGTDESYRQSEKSDDETSQQKHNDGTDDLDGRINPKADYPGEDVIELAKDCARRQRELNHERETQYPHHH
ncbi:hypothetical protein [Lacisediminihabitans sp.]|jgi:hypothetical protein|uniref:hypothetical protein n=1 Tax=Lacisediminihabitans sp. TaxID=2787631 RepID=UPI002F95AEAD